MRIEMDLCDVLLAPGIETDTQHDQKLAKLVIELLSAWRLRDAPEVEWILSRLDHEHGVKLTFASDLDHQNSLTQVKTIDNPALLERYRLKMIAPEMDGYKRVPMIMFREEPLSDAEYDRILSPLATTALLQFEIDKTFSLSEVELLKKYFKSVEPTWDFLATPVKPIMVDSFGSVVGGFNGCETDIIHWHHKDTGKYGPLELPIGVYVNLRAAEAGPYIDGLAVSSKSSEQKGVHFE